MHLENSIESFIRELDKNNALSIEYENIYKISLNNEKLIYIFSSLHALITKGFEIMNERLPTHAFNAHFWADPSRSLLFALDISDRLIRTLQGTEYVCDYDKYYKNLVKRCRTFLSRSGGSTIPENFDSVELYYTIPIFIFSNTIVTPNNPNISYKLTQKGYGSYANVLTYFDEFYQTKFAVKKAFENLNEKELLRFKQEFDTMKSLKSPYVLTVYSYDTNKNQYTMEYMDKTLDEYILENNNKLTTEQRKNLIFQILKAFSYIHSKSILHRDISTKNILIKLYDDVPVLKVCDFGLVKLPESTLTSQNTELKGFFNDPSLVLDGFNNYNILHETYALTRLIVFVLTGKVKLDKIKDEKLLSFIHKGLNADKSQRYKDVLDLKCGVLELFK